MEQGETHMYIFQRTTTLQGGYRKPLGWAVEMTEFVNANTDLDVGLWVGGFGFPLGTVAWSARVESRDQLQAAIAGLMEINEYHDRVEAGQEFVTTPGQDSLRQLIFPDAMPEGAPPVGAVATLTTASAAAGHIADAIGWGVEIAGIFAETTGSQASFLVDSYGAYGQVTWISVQESMAATDAANAALMANPDYLKSIDDAGGFFVEGSGMQALATRIA
jgi:hypothetical protein